MIIVKVLWSLFINLDLIVIAVLIFGGIKNLQGKLGSVQKTITGSAAILLLFMLGDFPCSGRDILRHLEARSPQIEIPKDTHGIVITGGSLCLFESDIRGDAVYHKTAGRLFDALKVAHANPQTEIIFAGSKLESDEFIKLATSLGVSQNRIKVVSDEKLNSLEAVAEEAVKLSGTAKNQKWLLITSAFSMPRTLSVFQSNNWNLIPYPVDYHTIGHKADKKNSSFLERLLMSFQDRLGLVAWNIAWREIAGLCNLKLSGKTKTLLPNTNATKI